MEWITPMEPISAKKLIAGEGWIHQIKWDGIRGLTYINEGSLRIFTKRGNERTDFYPELGVLKDIVRAKSVVLDGEIVILGPEYRPAFHLSLIRERVRNKTRVEYYVRRYPVLYIIFDILYLNGRLITQLPLYERKEILLNTVDRAGNISITEDFADGQGLFKLMKQKNWEGIVSKKADSPYRPAKNHNAWYKLKTIKKILTVVCGVGLRNGLPNSLILGFYRDSSLIYIGNASLGLAQKDLYTLSEYSSRLRSEKSPFLQSSGLKNKDVIWFKPLLTCWVSFLEWTNDGVLRHPKILGFAGSKPSEADGREWALDE